MFLSAVFLSGVLIGGIYTPDISSTTNAAKEQIKMDQKKTRPLKMKHRKKRRMARNYHSNIMMTPAVPLSL
jgi:hypothetical protein